MKEIRKVVQKLSRGQEAAAAQAAAAAYEPVQKHKVTPGIPGWLNNQSNYQMLINLTKQINNRQQTQ